MVPRAELVYEKLRLGLVDRRRAIDGPSPVVERDTASPQPPKLKAVAVIERTGGRSHTKVFHVPDVVLAAAPEPQDFAPQHEGGGAGGEAPPAERGPEDQGGPGGSHGG